MTSKLLGLLSQSRQNAKLFLKSPSELGLPQHLTRRRVCPPTPPGSGGRGTFAGERGGGRVPIPTRGHTLWYSLYIRTLCLLLWDCKGMGFLLGIQIAQRNAFAQVWCWKWSLKWLLSDCKECSCWEKSPIMLNYFSSVMTWEDIYNLLSHLCAARKAGRSQLYPPIQGLWIWLLHGDMIAQLTAVPLWRDPEPSGEKRKAGGWPRELGPNQVSRVEPNDQHRSTRQKNLLGKG